jgi:oligopeptidase A
VKENPLLVPDRLPSFPDIDASHVVPAITHLVRTLELELTALEEHAGADWETVECLTDVAEPLTHAWGVVGHLMAVRNSPQLRAAHSEVQPHVVGAFMRVAQSKTLFCALSALQQIPAWPAFNRAQQRTVEKKLLDARLSGMDLQGAARDRFNALETELSEVETTFGNHVLDATKAWSMVLTDGPDVAGLPQSCLAMAAQSARLAGHAQASAEQGPWRITLDAPSYGPFMRHARSRLLREHTYRAYMTRASQGEHDNTGLIDRILALRAEKAALLGFPSFAELSLATKMVPSVDTVQERLEELRAAAFPAAEKDLEAVRALAARGIPSVDPLEVAQWDVEYLAERIREERFSFTEEELRPYFPFPRVLAGLFSLAERLFGVVVTPATEKAPRWHPDVQYFEVSARDGLPLAAFYLDPYSRPENKRGGAWADECIARRQRAGSQDPPRLPVAYLCCNQTPPVDGAPSLMTFHEVETLFHEFGHGLQHMLTTVNCAEVSGLRGIEWDAIELPSQFMENWCYHRETLMGISGHYLTGERIPALLFDKILAARTFRAGSMMLRQIHFARVDLELHHGMTPGGAESVFDVNARIAKETSVLAPVPWDRFLCGFTHIFSGGYAAGYYSYKWAEVLSADAFAAFEDAGLDAPSALQSVGQRFRETILALGGAEHPLEVFRRFRGRPPSTAALLRHSGLTTAA